MKRIEEMKVAASRFVIGWESIANPDIYSKTYPEGSDPFVSMVFLKFIRIPLLVGRIVGWMAPCMFGVYLIHETIPGGRKLFEVPERYLAETTSLSPLVIVLLAAIFTFIACTIIDYIRRLIFHPLDKKINPLLNKLDSVLYDDRSLKLHVSH